MKYEFRHKYPRTDAELLANSWQQISEADYWEALEIVPAIRAQGRAFMQCEMLCHMVNADGTLEGVYLTYIEVRRGQFYRKPQKLSSFDPIAYAAEIARMK